MNDKSRAITRARLLLVFLRPKIHGLDLAACDFNRGHRPPYCQRFVEGQMLGRKLAREGGDTFRHNPLLLFANGFADIVRTLQTECVGWRAGFLGELVARSERKRSCLHQCPRTACVTNCDANFCVAEFARKYNKFPFAFCSSFSYYASSSRYDISNFDRLWLTSFGSFSRWRVLWLEAHGHRRATL